MSTSITILSMFVGTQTKCSCERDIISKISKFGVGILRGYGWWRGLKVVKSCF